MSKHYLIEAKFGKTWVVIRKINAHKEALDYVREGAWESYPLRVIRVVKTVVFESKES
jgi:hypothetical protein